MAIFIKDIPPYTKQTKNISEVAQKVRDAFKNNKSPQDLLFRKLPSLSISVHSLGCLLFIDIKIRSK
jgi:hypothetical protein